MLGYNIWGAGHARELKCLRYFQTAPVSIYIVPMEGYPLQKTHIQNPYLESP